MDLSRRLVAVVLVYTTCIATMPVRAGEIHGTSSVRLAPTGPSMIGGMQSSDVTTKGAAALLDGLKAVRTPDLKSGQLIARGTPLKVAFPNKFTSLHSALPHLHASTVASGTSSSIVSNFNGTAIASGSYIWFNSVLKPSGIGSSPVRIFVRSGHINFTANGVSYSLPVPDATITFSPTASSATTAFDTSTNQWLTTVPTGLSGNTYLSGLTLPLPAGLPGGINPVTWSGQFYSDTSGIALNWQWAAAVYTQFTGTYGGLGVKPVDSNSASQYKNSDHAGTPESYKSYVTGGARGGGGSNYTGSYSGTGSVVPVVGTPNVAPTANAGPNQTVFVQSTVQLDGTGSTDPDGDPLTYQWSFTSIPIGSAATLTNPTSPQPTFVVDRAGSYTAQLIVNDGFVSSSPSDVVISTKNSPPVANAGPNQTVKTQSTVQLDGSKSSDVDGDPLTYSWSFMSRAPGSNATLSNATLVNPTFVSDVKGTYVVQLIVNDGQVDSSASTVTISDVNSPPVANAGPDQSIQANQTVHLDGGGSTDIDGDALTYRWSFTSVPYGSTATLSNTTAVNPTFVADLMGTYVAQLIVNDGTVDSTPSTVTISTGDVPPVANPGPPQTVPIGSLVNLDGSKSTDSDNAPLTYQWSLTTKPAASTAVVSNPTAVNPYFIADVNGNYVVQLIVNDGNLSSKPATVSISTINSPPIGNPGPNQTIEVGSTATIDGSASYDPDNTPLTYRWAILSNPTGSGAMLSDPTAAKPTFVADTAGLYVLQLIVNDGLIGSTPETTQVQANVNQPPVVNAGPNQTITLPTNSVTLNGSATDDGLLNPTLSIQWTNLSTSVGPVSFSSPTSAITQASFSQAGTYTLQLSAYDGQYTSTATTTVTVNPVPNQPPIVSAGPNQTIPYPNTLTLQGSVKSANTPPGQVTSLWTEVSGPPGVPPITFAAPTSATSTVQFNSQGTYVLQLTGTENGQSAGSQVTITAIAGNKAPVVNAGPDQTITLPVNAVVLSGSATDDGLPQGSTLTYSWSVVSGPGSMSFTQPTSPTTSASFSVQGTYTLRLTASDSQLTGSADVHIRVLPPDTPPVVNAGPNQVITLPTNTVQLNGAASESLSAPGPLTVHWSLVSATGTVSFANPNALLTAAVFSQAGTYDLRLTASDTSLQASSDTTVIVNPAPAPLAILTLSPTAAGPLAVSTSQTVTATLLDSQGHPVIGSTVQFLVTGANAKAGTAVTSSNGTAAFSYIGVNGGTDVIQAQATVSNTNVSSNSAQVSWVTPILPISAAGVTGQFFAAPNGYDAAGFNIPVGTPPLWTQSFPLINFNPCYGLPGYTVTSCQITPFFDAMVNSSGVYTGTNIVAQGNGFTAAQGGLVQFEAVFTGQFVVNAPSQMTLLVNSDDGFHMGVGNGASGSPTNPMVAAPSPRVSSFYGYPLVAAFNGITDPGVRHLVIINFPSAGNYPFEVDYAECCGGALTLSVVDAAGAVPNLARVTLSPNSSTIHPLTIGQTVTFTLHATNAQGSPLASVPVELQVTGPTAPGTPYRSTTNGNGDAFFSYRGNGLGTDIVTGVALSSTSVASYSSSVQQIWEAAANNPPQVNAGSNQTIQWPTNAVTLSGTVTDDGLPAGAPLTQEWSQVGGPTLAPGNGYAAGYAITIDHTKAPHTDQIDFPLEMAGTYPFLANAAYGGGVQSTNGWDIIFTSDAAGSNKLDHEIESYDPTTGAVTFWVRIPTLSCSVDTTIFMWYGNAGVTASQENKPGVWKNGYAGVWHLASRNLALDSTGNNLGTATNVTPIPGAIDGAGSFSGASNSYVRIQNSNSFKPSAALTLEGWVNPTTVTAWNTVIALDYNANGSWNPPYLSYALDLNNTSTGVAFMVANSGTINILSSARSIPLNSWSQIAGTFDANSHVQHVYINGVQDSNSLANNGASIDYGTSKDLALGVRSPYTPFEEWIGGLDELRISTVARSADWMATEYNNQSSPSTFYSLGGMVTFSTPDQPQTQATFSAPGTYLLQLSASDTQFTTASQVTITVQSTQQAPLVSAGPNQTVTLPNNVTLLGSVTETGLPAGVSLISQWTMLTGPAPVSFANPNQAVTSASFTQPGTYVVQLSGSDGIHTSAAAATIVVASAPTTSNQPPVVTGSIQLPAIAGASLTLSGAAKDDGLPNGVLTTQWLQLSGPASVSFTTPVINTQNVTSSTVVNATTQGVFPVAGSYQIQLSATDSQSTSTLIFNVIVASSSQPIQAPAVSAGSAQTITLPTVTTTLNGQVSDVSIPVNQLGIAWTLLNGPSPVTFSNPYAPSTQATFGQPGIYQLQLSASDGQYTSFSTTTVTVLNVGQTSQSLPPSVSAGPSQTITLPNNIANLSGSASGPAGYSLTIAWAEVSGPASVVFSNPNQTTTQATFSQPGTYVLQLSAQDSLATSTATTTVTVSGQATAPPPPPTVAISSPNDGIDVTQPAPITGSVTMSAGTWSLAYSLSDTNNPNPTWVTFASGTNSFTGTLGTLDPTLLLNGIYNLQLSATDSYGQTSTASTSVQVLRNMKLGQFSITFNDLSVPLPGLPIQITRTYDSRLKSVGDFGYGWTLGLKNVRLQKSRNLGKNWSEGVAWVGQFPQYCLSTADNRYVTLTFADGKVYKFQAVNNPQCQLYTPINVPQLSFTQVATGSGTAGATLVPADGGSALIDGPVPGPVNLTDYSANVYDPTQFIFTTAEGYVYNIDQTLGVTQVKDPNGNTLTINSNGVTSSTGKSVVFVRDTQNRITSIQDPAGVSLSYGYDASGNLSTFTDRAQNTTTFTYDTNNNHYLLNILDPRGGSNPAIKNVYDNAGRLLSTTDENGQTISYNPNLSANTEQITDRNNNITTYGYDGDGNVTSITTAAGTTTYTYDLNDNKLSELLPGHTNPTLYTYDQFGNKLTETDPVGNKTTYTYNVFKQVTSIVDANTGTQQGKTSNNYDPKGNLLSTTDAEGHVTGYAYYSNGQVKTMSVDGVQQASFVYDGAGNVTTQTDALGNPTTYTYDANGNKLTQSVTRTKSDGTKETLLTQYQYDGNGRLTKTIYPDLTFTQIVYNALGKQSDTYDQLQRHTQYAYDVDGRLQKTTYADGTFELTGYDNNGNRTSFQDRGGHVTSYFYDGLNRLTKTQFADGSYTQTVYNPDGTVQTSYDALRNATNYGYDDAGRRTSLTDAMNKLTTFGYDNVGNQTSVLDANQHQTQFVYDKLGRKTQTVYPDQTTDTTHYDSLGRVDYKLDQAGVRTDYGYDGDGRLTSVTQYLNFGQANQQSLVTQYGYDEVGNRISQTDANQHTTKYVYDQLGRRISRTVPAGQSESYGYDAVGNLQQKIDFNGKTTAYAYDSNNRLQSKTPDPSFSAPAIGFTYSATGKRLTMSDVSGVTTYTYDPQTDRLMQKQTPEGTLNYTYDAAGNLKSLQSQNQGGASDAYTYDLDNRLSTVVDASGTTTYAYDNVGNLQSFAYPNGVTTAYTYDTLNRLTQMGAGKNGAQQANYVYTLGAAGNRLTVAELSGRMVNYGYDSLYRLTSEAITNDPNNHNNTTQYQYDNVGNRQQLIVNGTTANVYSYDADDRLGSDQYDANGNTTSSGGTTSTYDFENHLVSKGGVTIVYDGDGNRVSETVAGVTTQYLVDTQNATGYAQVVDEIQNGSVVKSYSYGLERISQRPTTNGQGLSFYGYDGHGSVRQLTNGAGAVTDTYDFDAFGNLISSTGNTPNNYLFSGEQYDPALGLYYSRARYLNTSTGRFWTMDTEEGQDVEPLTLHKYLYGNADPVDGLDPSGNDDIGGIQDMSATLDSIPTLQLKGVTNAVPFGRGLARDATDLSDLGLQFIAGHEGWSSRNYPDADGNCTIGYGHLLHYGKCTAGDINNISRDTGLQFLHDDVGKATKSIAKRVRVPLAQQEYDALTDFEFNTGALASSSLLTDLNDQIYASVPFKFMQYVYTHRTVNGRRKKVLLDNLLTRRSEEGELWVFGIYRVNGAVIGQLHYVQ